MTNLDVRRLSLIYSRIALIKFHRFKPEQAYRTLDEGLIV